MVLLDVFAWLGEVVGHGHGEAAAAAASGGRRGERDLGRGRVQDGMGSEGASEGEDRGAAGGGILIAFAVTPASWSDWDCPIAGAWSHEQWGRKATEGVRGWAGLAGPRLS